MTARTWGYLLSVTGAFVGGVTVGMLLSPKTGKENREYIKREASEASDKVKGAAKDLKKNFPDLYEATGSFSLNEDDVLTLTK
jgi:gas vesicle protein